MTKLNPLAWDNHFPSVYGHTSISFLKQCKGFGDAKHGNMNAALKVVKNCINPYTVIEIQRKYPDAILLPVVSNNKLPEALAVTIGMKTHAGIYMFNSSSRKSLSGMERLLNKPVFGGEIIKGKNYIIVDDIITQGGTVSELRKYVITNGGYVSAIVTLSCSIGSKVIVPNQEDMFSLINRFSLPLINDTLRHYNIAYDVEELTSSQVRYLLHFKKLDRIINKIEDVQMAITAPQIKNGF